MFVKSMMFLAKIVSSCFRLLPFGAGRRICAGEVLAKNRLFLVMACLVQNVDFEAVPGKPKPNHDARYFIEGFPMNPKPFEIYAHQRPKH